MSSEFPEDDSSNHMELRTTQCNPIAVLFGTLKEAISEVNILFNTEGIIINTYDTSRSIFINVSLYADQFDHYYCKKQLNDYGEEIASQIYVNVHNINNVLKSITTNDNIIKWSYNPKDEYFKISIISNIKSEERTYDILVQDGPEVCPEIHSVDSYKYKLTMPSADLSTIFKHLKQLNVETVKIKYVEMSLTFQAVSKTGINATITRFGSKGESGTDDDGSNGLIIEREPEHISVYYDEFKFTYLYNFTKCAKISGKSGGSIVVLHLSDDEPFAIQFNVGKLGTVIFFLGSNQPEIE